MTLTDVAPRAATAPSKVNDTAAPKLASWPARAGALGLDVLPGTAVLTAAALVALTVPLRGGWWWACVCLGATAVLWTGWNRLLLPGASGQSLGRRTFGITVARRDGSAAGPVRLLLRDVAHLLDTAPALVGWLWPMKDPRRRTFADMVSRTESHVMPASETTCRPRRTALAVVLTAAAVCVALAVLGVTSVALPDRAVAATSAAITARGPHIVEQILSYHPDTIDAEFEHAQSLVTDDYRERLTAQQQAIRKAGPMRNEYWVTNSAVLSATDERATMLLFLQGQRGAPPDQRYLTATVRVLFVESDAAPWRVDDLTVVTSPQPIEAKP